MTKMLEDIRGNELWILGHVVAKWGLRVQCWTFVRVVQRVGLESGRGIGCGGCLCCRQGHLGRGFSSIIGGRDCVAATGGSVTIAMDVDSTTVAMGVNSIAITVGVNSVAIILGHVDVSICQGHSAT